MQIANAREVRTVLVAQWQAVNEVFDSYLVRIANWRRRSNALRQLLGGTQSDSLNFVQM
jgi:hypothetical protein